MLTEIVDRCLLGLRLRLYPFIHSFSCAGKMVVYVPTNEYMETDNESYMMCDLCGKKYHMAYVTPDDDEEE